MFDAQTVKKDFPIFETYPQLVYLDSAATSQKPQVVLDAVDEFSRKRNANVHRGLYKLGELATEAFEGARQTVAQFIGATPEEIIYTRNATEAINLVARTWATQNLRAGDIVLLTEMEHHSNIVPWQLLAKATGIVIEYLPITADGRLDQDGLSKKLRPGVKLMSVTQMSNVLGTVNPVADLIRQAHAVGAKVLVDGAQAIAQMPVNVRDLDADFYAFSGHKMLAPFGIGVLYGKRGLLEATEPLFGGGEMINEVSLQTSTWNDLPYKFEAGTPNAAGAVGLAAAIEYINRLGRENIWQHERTLTAYALEQLRDVPGLTIYGPRDDQRGGAIPFSLAGVHPHDIASLLDEENIAVRAGHHCTQPLHKILGVPATTRATFSVYTTMADIDALARGLNKVAAMFASA